MIVVSDTSPINYLVQLGLIDLLPELYGRVSLPLAVLEELQAAGSPQPVRDWSGALPVWFSLKAISGPVPQELRRLDPGEREAITLALELNAETILIDEFKGRRVAGQLGLVVAGTLAVLRDAAELGRLEFDEAVQRLLALGFRASNEVIEGARPKRGT